SADRPEPRACLKMRGWSALNRQCARLHSLLRICPGGYAGKRSVRQPAQTAIVRFALAFAPTHDAQAFQPAELGSDDGALALAVVAVVVEHHPVVGLAHIVRAGGIREERGVMAP